MLADDDFQPIAIVVACLASFRQLFVKSNQSDLIAGRKDKSSWSSRLISILRSMRTAGSSLNKGFVARESSHKNSSRDSTEQIVPLEYIRVDSVAERPFSPRDADLASLHNSRSSSFGAHNFGNDQFRDGQTRG